MKEAITIAKQEFYNEIQSFGTDPYDLNSHVNEMEKWGIFMCDNFPEANREVVLLSVWLHDIGHYPIPTDIDHAIRSEERAKKILISINYPKEKMNQALHCIRAHRCKDVLPQTLEAKIIAFIDSASHMTTNMYFNIIRDYKLGRTSSNVFDKMERDLRDLDSFPEIKLKVLELYEAWKKLLKEYEKIDFLK